MDRYCWGTWFVEELTSKIIADSGIPSDRYHLGKIILQSFKNYPEAILQIDGATGQSETNEQMHKRAVQCATSFRNFGLQVGDVIVLMAPSHLDLSVPFYAALFTGGVVAAIDMTLGPKELQQYFEILQPKLIFCQSKKAADTELALNESKSRASIVTFDKGENLCSLKEFNDKYSEDIPLKEFKATDFDASTALAFLISTSGTTGLPKSAEITHKNFALSLPCLMYRYNTFPGPFYMSLIPSPIQWLTALHQFVISPVFKFIRLQTSQNFTREHGYDLINKYRPSFAIFSPTLMTTMVNPETRHICDFTSFETILLGGSAVSSELIITLKEISPHTKVANGYGMSELCGLIFHLEFDLQGSCGTPMDSILYRLIDPDSGKDLTEPNVPGELWLSGPKVFKGYYNNKAATAEAFNGEWFKTGDMFYRDERYNFYFKERIKSLLKYKNHQISPVELENVIRQHPNVLDVAVTGISDPECGDLPVACVVPRVVPRAGKNIEAEELKKLVRESLTDTKQLRGGVVFMNAIPMTATTKVDRLRLKELVKTAQIY